MTTAVRERWLPSTGEVFKSRDSLIEILRAMGWELEGCGPSFGDNGKMLNWDIGVQDTPSRTWVLIELKPYKKSARVSKVHYPISSPDWNPDLQ